MAGTEAEDSRANSAANSIRSHIRLQTSGAVGFIPKSELTAEAVSGLVGAP